ncbi:flagellar export chaperone FliS [Sphingomonas baiyangensis]|uniref:Flagellar secretion chaperone FliS n=1 Tax=Sphingomonas baiyangensis TaxID=2572576 RepID=A0A4U1L600_9SPHN|nr:flagellar export chaperone FliS [Sphingomonas baiyangensis]TKD52014.1 flagellar export chaperone FliS [Sphingomonas baiyangensis]
MPRYATALAADPATTYRQIDLTARTQSADPHMLVTLLYDELIAALGAAAWATERRNFKVKGERVTRATAILFALEAGLDFDKGGAAAQSFATLYRASRQQVVDASIGNDPAPFRRVAGDIADIAQAWKAMRPQ